MNDHEFKIKLLEKEIEALRSVINELRNRSEDNDFPSDVDCYVQWHAAQAFQETRNHLK